MLAAAGPARRAADGGAGARAGGGRRRRGRAAARAGVSRARRPLVCTVRVSGRPSAGECAAGPRGPARRGARGAARRARDWSPGVMCPPSDVNGGNAGRRRGLGLARAGSAGGGGEGRARPGWSRGPGAGGGGGLARGTPAPRPEPGTGAGRLTSRRAAPPRRRCPGCPGPRAVRAGGRGPAGCEPEGPGPGPGRAGPKVLGEGCPTWDPRPALAAQLDGQVTPPPPPSSGRPPGCPGDPPPPLSSGCPPGWPSDTTLLAALAAHLDDQVTLHPQLSSGHPLGWPLDTDIPSNCKCPIRYPNNEPHKHPVSAGRTLRAFWSFTDVCLPLESSGFCRECGDKPPQPPSLLAFFLLLESDQFLTGT